VDPHFIDGKEEGHDDQEGDQENGSDVQVQEFLLIDPS
jgi:hypothetical protein